MALARDNNATLNPPLTTPTLTRRGPKRNRGGFLLRILPGMSDPLDLQPKYRAENCADARYDSRTEHVPRGMGTTAAKSSTACSPAAPRFGNGNWING